MNIGLPFKCAAIATILFAKFVAATPEERDFTAEFVTQCKVKAETGDAEAQVLYGIALSNGWGVEKDKAKTVEWYREAAEQGHLPAQQVLDRVKKHLRQLQGQR